MEATFIKVTRETFAGWGYRLTSDKVLTRFTGRLFTNTNAVNKVARIDSIIAAENAPNDSNEKVGG